MIVPGECIPVCLSWTIRISALTLLQLCTSSSPRQAVVLWRKLIRSGGYWKKWGLQPRKGHRISYTTISHGSYRLKWRHELQIFRVEIQRRPHIWRLCYLGAGGKRHEVTDGITQRRNGAYATYNFWTPSVCANKATATLLTTYDLEDHDIIAACLRHTRQFGVLLLPYLRSSNGLCNDMNHIHMVAA